MDNTPPCGKNTVSNHFKTKVVIYMPKRKAERNAVEKHAKTPKKNIEETEFSVEFAAGEDPMKGANRNSQYGRKGRGKQ